MKNCIIVIFVSFLLTGCLEFNILVKVNPDGSGTVEQTVLMSKAIVSQMQEVAKSFGAKEEKGKKDFSLIDRKKLKDEAKSMGKGVSFINAKQLSTDNMEGYIAYYSFKDINSLKVSENPSGKVHLEQGSNQQPPDEPLIFSFKPGSPATLVIHQPKKSFGPDSTLVNSNETHAGVDDTSGFDTMVEMMKGFRVSFMLQINGTIIETNATNIKDSQITLLDINFEQLVRNREQFKEISKHPPQTADEMKKVLKDVKGIKMELENETTVKFK